MAVNKITRSTPPGSETNIGNQILSQVTESAPNSVIQPVSMNAQPAGDVMETETSVTVDDETGTDHQFSLQASEIANKKVVVERSLIEHLNDMVYPHHIV